MFTPHFLRHVPLQKPAQVEKEKPVLPCPLCGRTRPPLPSDEVKTKGCSFGCGYPLPASDDARTPKP